MRILAIRGSNLTSLAGDFEVDFATEALARTGLFAITGPVGAGKSTLLDALCLALYNRTPRMPQPGGASIGRIGEDEKQRLRANDVRSMLRRGTASGFAEVDFLGNDSIAYRARWSVRRARSKVTGTMQQQHLTLKERDSDRRVGGNNSEVLAEIQARLGLSFDQFCRSVLLAQGDFARFLRAEERDRAALLERMTGTELYSELSMAAHARVRELRQEVTLWQAQLDQLRILSDDKREHLGTEEVRLETAQRELEAKCQAAADAARWYREQDRLETGVVDARADLSLSQEKVRDLSAQDLKCEEAFSAAMEGARSENIERREALTGQRNDLVRWLSSQGHLEPLARDEDRWSRVLARYRDSAGALRVLEQTRIDAEQRRAELRDATKTAIALREERERTLDASDSARKAAVEAVVLADPGDLAARIAALETELEVIRTAKGLHDSLATVASELRELESRASQADEEVQAATRAWTAECDRLAELKVRLDEAERAWRQAQRAASLEEHRHELTAGEPCPLCGALEHPLVERTGDPDGGQEERVAELRRRSDAASANLARVDQVKTQHEQAAREARLRIESSTSRQIQLRQDLPAPFKDPTVVENGLEDCLRRRATLLGDQRRVAELHRVSRKAQVEYDKCRDAWSRARDDLRRGESDLLAAEQALVQCDADRVHQEETSAGSLSELELVFGSVPNWRGELAANPGDFIAKHQSDAVRFARAQTESASLAEQLAALTRQGESLEALRSSRDEKHFDAAVAALSQARDAAGLAETVQREWRRVHRVREETATLRDRVRSLEAVLAERERNLVEHQGRADRPSATAVQARSQQVALRPELARAKRRLVDVQHERLRDRDARAERDRLTASIEKRRAEGKTWEAIDDLIGSHDGRSFRVYAQSLTLECLLDSANHHLQDLAPRYRLQRVPGSELSLQVVDLDMAEEVRGVNSLSGGESFLVSLALALGLSSLASDSTRIESLLIDEGFGNLDLQSLDTALATLDALQASGRQVGVVSHVAGIAERIGVQVEVAPVGPGRSRVRVVEA